MAFFHRERPSFYRFHQTYHIGDKELSFFLDTGKKEQVIGLYYEWNGSDDFALQLSELCQRMNGQNFADLQTVASLSQSQFPMAFFWYRRFTREIKEEGIPWSAQKGRDPLSLLCRCFGVYIEDIHELIGSGVEVTGLRDLGDHLRAGIGCGSCKEDLLETLNPLLSEPIKELPKTYEQSLWEKLDPQALANEVHQILRQFQGGHGEFGVLKLGGIRPGSVLVGIDREMDEDTKGQLRDLLQAKLDEVLGPGLGLVFLSL